MARIWNPAGHGALCITDITPPLPSLIILIIIKVINDDDHHLLLVNSGLWCRMWIILWKIDLVSSTQHVFVGTERENCQKHLWIKSLVQFCPGLSFSCPLVWKWVGASCAFGMPPAPGLSRVIQMRCLKHSTPPINAPMLILQSVLCYTASNTAMPDIGRCDAPGLSWGYPSIPPAVIQHQAKPFQTPDCPIHQLVNIWKGFSVLGFFRPDRVHLCNAMLIGTNRKVDRKCCQIVIHLVWLVVLLHHSHHRDPPGSA